MQSSSGHNGFGFADNRPQALAQLKLKEMAAAFSEQRSRAEQTTENEGVVQRQVDWFAGPRTRNRDLTNSLLYYHDFAITPVIVNGEEFPGGNPAQAIAGPAFMIDPQENGLVHLTVAAEPINRVGYRMELPTPAPWVAYDTFLRAETAIGTGGFSIEDELAPEPNRIIEIQAHGLPNDNTFANLVEVHENHHVADVRRITRNMIEAWDDNIQFFIQNGNTIVGNNADEAIATFYARMGATPAELGTAYRNAVRDAGNHYHTTPEGHSPVIDSTSFLDGPMPRMNVYWEHALG